MVDFNAVMENVLKEYRTVFDSNTVNETECSHPSLVDNEDWSSLNALVLISFRIS